MNTPRRRRVLFLIPTLTGGGAERVIVTLLQHLDRSQFALTLAVVDTRDAAFMVDVPTDVELVDLGCRRVRQALPKIIALLWKKQPDVVLSTLGHLNLALSIAMPLLPRKTRYLARETTIVSQGLAEYKHPQRWAAAYRSFYHRFDRVICQSVYMRDDLVQNYGIALNKSVVINNPLDIQRILKLAAEPLPDDEPLACRTDPDPAKVYLVAAGRLVAQKGFDVMLEALALAKNHSLHLTVLGEGPEHEALQQQAARLGIADRVRFAGFQRNPYAFFAKADAFVSASSYEGFPNVVLEALACGKPIVASPAPGGLPEIVAPISGCLLADAMGPKALALALDRLEVPQTIPASKVNRYAVGTIVAAYALELSSKGS